MTEMKKVLVLLISVLMICGIMAGCGSSSPTAGNSVKTGFGSEQVDAADSALASIPVSHEIVDNARVSYLGPEGTYTEEATQLFFSGEASDEDSGGGSNGVFMPKETVEDAIADVVNGDADYAVIPQENTLGGAVTNYVDALIAEEDIYVVGEVVLPINQTLMGVPGAKLEDIQTVCSHTTGTELVAVHDRPEGSQLGTYNYIIEVEDENGISDELIDSLLAIPEIRFLGRFQVMEKLQNG